MENISHPHRRNRALSAICDALFMCAVNGDNARPFMPSREHLVAVYEAARLSLDGTDTQSAAATDLLRSINQEACES